MFRDHGLHLAHFHGEYHVRCPRCEGRALVTVDDTRPDRTGTAAVSCTTCGFSRARGETSWMGPLVGTANRRCGRCGTPLTKQVRHGSPPRTVPIQCPSCEAVSETAVSWRPDDDTPRDPVVGLPLWYQAPVGSHVLWAYNPGHLAFIRDYVSAGIRRREPNENASLASRLPRWLKAGKNREAVLKAISRLGTGEA